MAGLPNLFVHSWFSTASNSWRMSTWWLPDDKSSTAHALLRVLSVAHREQIGIAPLVRNLALEHRFASRRRLNRLAKRVETGTPLIEALEQTPDALPDADVLTLRFASETGTLTSAYHDLVSRAEHASFATSVRIRQAIVYAICIAVVVFLILSFMCVLIVPTFKQMFEEFGLRLPIQLLALISACEYVARYMLPIGVTLAIVFLLSAWIVKPFRYFRRILASRMFRPVANLRSSHLLRMLAMASKAGRPIAGSLSTLARYHYDTNLRNKLLFARNEMEQGADAWNSLANADLVSARESQAMKAASSPGFRSWLMEQIAKRKEDHFEYRSAFWSMLLHPVFVLLFGAIVVWITTSFFGVLTTMIRSLA